MSTIILFLSIGLVVLAIASRLPGLEHLVKPFIELFFWILKALLEHAGAWIVYLVKSLLNAHRVLLMNLTNPASKLDPVHKYREETERRERGAKSK